MEDRNMQSGSFVREKIKDKPVNKKKILLHMLYMGASGLIFGLAAITVFGIGYHILQKKNASSEVQTQPPQTQITPPPAATTQDSQSETQTPEDVELTVSDYQNMQYELYNVGAECNKSVVSVTGVTSDTDLFNNAYESQGIGAGIIIRDTGTEYLILTERKLIRKASEIRVAFADGYECAASVKGEDVNTGIAVLSVSKGAIPADTQSRAQVALFSEYATSRAGTFVIAVGCPLDSNYSILTGHITSSGNKITTRDHNYTVVTTDMVGSESSFGILVNVSGEIVGVVLQGIHGAGNDNTLVAISSSDITPVIDVLCKGDTVPYLGLQVSTVSEHIADTYGMPKGVYIREVDMDSPAMEVGLQSGDVIIKMDGSTINADTAYSSLLMKHKTGDTIPIVIKRKGANGYMNISYKATLGALEK